MLRVVFDTSSLVGAALRAGSVPHAALQLALANASLLASPRTLDELQCVLRRSRFDRYQSIVLRREFFDIFARAAIILDVPAEEEQSVRPACRDPQDNKFLALAAESEADVIVSSDADLLTLDPWNGIRVVRPAQFLAQFGSSP